MRVYYDFDLTHYNSYRIHAKCKRAYFPDNEEEIVQLFEKGKDVIVLGGGNNIVFSKQNYDNNFNIFNGNFNHIDFEGEIIEAESGTAMHDLCIKALEWELSGIEIFYDIPSSLGGAIVMNAGASGEEIKDVIIKVRFLDLENMKIKEILNNDIAFEFRDSIFQKDRNKIVLKAWLKLTKKNKKEIAMKMETIKLQRWAKQPREFPNAGSVFKRPHGRFVGQMIEELGLKGYSIGGAQISEKHCGFIINTGNATGKEILALIDYTKKKIKEKFNIDLEVEQKII